MNDINNIVWIPRRIQPHRFFGREFFDRRLCATAVPLAYILNRLNIDFALSVCGFKFLVLILFRWKTVFFCRYLYTLCSPFVMCC